MRWVKQRVLIAPPIGPQWSASHAAVPHVDVRSDDSLRIYFTTRDERGRSVMRLGDEVRSMAAETATGRVHAQPDRPDIS